MVDALRGLAMLAVIWYHTLWDLVNLYDISISWFASDLGFAVQRTIRWCFVLIAGFCFSMGSRPVKRGLMLIGCSVVVTGASYIVGSPIIFGILTFLGIASLLGALWKWITGNKSATFWRSCLGFAVCLALGLWTVNVEIRRMWGVSLPGSWYANYLTAFLGFPHLAFESSDYVPLIPWIFAYGMGYYLYGIMKSRQWLGVLGKGRIKPLEFMGRHSLLIYLAHQPIVYGVLMLVFS